MKIPLLVRYAFCCGLLFVLFSREQGLAQSAKKIALGGALSAGRVANNTYINESLGLQFAPSLTLRFGAPQLKGNPGTVPLLVTIAAWGDGGAVFYADDLGYYAQDRRSTQAYVVRVTRSQKKEGLDLAGGQLEERLGGVTFARVDSHQARSYEAMSMHSFSFSQRPTWKVLIGLSHIRRLN